MEGNIQHLILIYSGSWILSVLNWKLKACRARSRKAMDQGMRVSWSFGRWPQLRATWTQIMGLILPNLQSCQKIGLLILVFKWQSDCLHDQTKHLFSCSESAGGQFASDCRHLSHNKLSTNFLYTVIIISPDYSNRDVAVGLFVFWTNFLCS